MSYEFRVAPHSILPDTQMVECWRNGKFVAGIYAEQSGIRVVSKFTQYPLHRMGLQDDPRQWCLFASPKRGITAHYEIRVDEKP